MRAHAAWHIGSPILFAQEKKVLRKNGLPAYADFDTFA